MARVNNLSNFLTDVASAIKTKKGSETAIPAANFDTEILALPSQGVYQTKVITINENGQTVITPDSGYDAMDGVQVTTNVPEKQLQTKSYDFTTNQTIELSPDTGYDGFDSVVLTINVPTIDTSDATATASDIASGKTAYVNGGKVTGNIPSAGSTDIMVDDANLNVTVNRGYDVVQAIYRNQNKMIYNTNHTMTQNIKFSQLATLGNITANKIVSGNTIFGVVGTGGGSGGSGDVKLFDTVEQMEQDTTAQEGDLAIIYRDATQPVQEESEFSSCIFPQTVVLDEAFTGSTYGRFGPVDDVWFDGRLNMSSSVFRFSGYGDSGQVMVQYTSQDGITYTRTDGGEELQEFGTTIKWQSMGGPFNSIIGNFMKIGGKYFDGLYEYKQKGQYGIPYNFRIENNTLLYDIIPFDVPSFAKSIGVNTKSGTLVIMKRDENGDFIGYYSNNSSGQSIVKYNGRLYYANRYGANCSYTDLSTGETTSLTNGQQVTVGSITTYIMLDTEMEDNDKLVYFIPSGNWEYNVYIDTYTLLQPSGGFRYQSYYFADTQLDATSEYVYEKTFYGKNGVETGTLTTNISSTFDDKNGEVYNKIQQVYNSMTPLVATDNDKRAGLGTSIIIIPSKSDGTPLLDTSNVTNMSYMFNNYTSLTTIPLLDTNKATNMSGMFTNCTSLTTIPLLDTSKATDMSYMFSGCTSLTTIPLLDTSKATNMSYIFGSCTSLTTIPLLDTSKATDMNGMFHNCTLLEEIDLSGGTINSSATHNDIFYNVPTTCVIYVKDQASKTLLESWDNTHTYTIKTI